MRPERVMFGSDFPLNLYPKLDETPGLIRFVQEAKAASALNHPNIVTIHDITSDLGVDFMVMEWIDGKTLDELIPRHGMRLPEVLRIAVQIAEGLFQKK